MESVKTIHVERRSRRGEWQWVAWIDRPRKMTAYGRERLETVGRLVDDLLKRGVPVAQSVGIDSNAGAHDAQDNSCQRQA